MSTKILKRLAEIAYTLDRSQMYTHADDLTKVMQRISQTTHFKVSEYDIGILANNLAVVSKTLRDVENSKFTLQVQPIFNQIGQIIDGVRAILKKDENQIGDGDTVLSPLDGSTGNTLPLLTQFAQQVTQTFQRYPGYKSNISTNEQIHALIINAENIISGKPVDQAQPASNTSNQPNSLTSTAPQISQQISTLNSAISSGNLPPQQLTYFNSMLGELNKVISNMQGNSTAFASLKSPKLIRISQYADPSQNSNSINTISQQLMALYNTVSQTNEYKSSPLKTTADYYFKNLSNAVQEIKNKKFDKDNTTQNVGSGIQTYLQYGVKNGYNMLKQHLQQNQSPEFANAILARYKAQYPTDPQAQADVSANSAPTPTTTPPAGATPTQATTQ